MLVAAIPGSLRIGSYNRALLRAAQQLAPSELRIRIHGLGEIPFFNEDVENTAIPPAVVTLRAAVEEADALLIATPEYNYGVPGVLKNAFDWLSRPPGKSVLAGKPAGIIGASVGSIGTARAQLALRQSFTFTNTPVMLQPEVLVARAQEKFDAERELVDDATRQFLSRWLQAFLSWSSRLATPVRRTHADQAHRSAAAPADARIRGDLR